MPKVADAPPVPLKLLGSFPSHWKEKTLNEACRHVTDGTHDSPKESSTGFPLITGRCITKGRIDFSRAYLISEKDHLEVIARSKPERGDVLFANIGNSIGDMASVDTDEPFSIKNVALFKPGSELNPRYLKYWLFSPFFQDYVRSSALGSAQPFVGLNTLRSLPIPVPPKNEQNRIAEILGSLDDKIELNLKTNETLEQLARAIFKWFIDFDPVRAKQRGKKPFGMDDDTAALFPDGFERSELGEIPKGWKLSKLEDVVAYLSRGIGPSYTETGGIRVFNQKCVRDGVVSATQARRHDPSKRSTDGRLLKEKDILVNSTGTGTLGRVGQIWIIDEPSIVDSHVTIVRNDPAKISSCLLGLDLRMREAEIEALAEGSTGQTELSKSRLGGIGVAVAPREIQAAADLFLEPMISLIYSNLAENTSLSKMRDLLLPRLLSGELSVKEVDACLASQ